MTTTESTSPQRNTQRRLSEAQKRAIVAAVATGLTQKQVAQRFKVHPNTVSTLCKPVVSVQEGPLSPHWRTTLQNEAPEKAVKAIVRSLDDEIDVHKAASTGIATLKGLGHLANEGGNTTIFMQQINALPADWASQFAVTPSPTGCGLLPDNGATTDVIDVTPLESTPKPSTDQT